MPRLTRVGGDAAAIVQTDGEVIGGHRVALFGQSAQAGQQAAHYPHAALALGSGHAEVKDGDAVARFGRLFQPAHGRLGIGGDAAPGEIHQPQLAGGQPMTLLGRHLVPACRFQVVGHAMAAIALQVTDNGRGLGIALQRGAAQPCFGGRHVACDAPAMHQSEAEPRLGGPHPGLGRALVKTRGSGLIRGNRRHPGLMQRAEHIDGSGNISLSRAGEEVGRPRRIGHPIETQQPNKPQAKRRLHAAARHRLFVKMRGLGVIARATLAHAPEIAQQRLAITLPRLGGLLGEGAGAGRIGADARLAEGARAWRRGEAAKQHGGQPGLRLAIAGLGCGFQPAHTLGRVGRHTLAPQIGGGHAFLCLRPAGAGIGHGAAQIALRLGQIGRILRPRRLRASAEDPPQCGAPTARLPIAHGSRMPSCSVGMIRWNR